MSYNEVRFSSSPKTFKLVCARVCGERKLLIPNLSSTFLKQKGKVEREAIIKKKKVEKNRKKKRGKWTKGRKFVWPRVR